jgi:hypothetical protein
MTGAGIYRDTVLLGRPAPTKAPVLNAQVFGSDSVINELYKGRLHWFWGDTLRPSYPLGNFHVPGATSLLPSQGGLDPDVGVNLEYYLDKDGFAKATAKLPGEGPTWLFGLVTLKDSGGTLRLYASYMKVRGFLDVYERGLVVFNDDTKTFEKLVTFPKDALLYPNGHPVKHHENGVEYLYFPTAHPYLRVKATVDDMSHPERYETYTCFKEGTQKADGELERGTDGKIRFGWKANTIGLSVDDQIRLIRTKTLKPEEGLLALTDIESGKPVKAHGSSVYWNDYRKRWVMIFVESGGTSLLGEVWYAEAEDLLGPWVFARKVATHNRYSFYNPKQHPLFAKDGGRFIYFEGTYTNMFSGNTEATPRYEYNQVMYKLDLNDPRLTLPVPVDIPGDPLSSDNHVTPYFALDRASQGSVPVDLIRDAAGNARLVAPTNAEGDKTAKRIYLASQSISAAPLGTVALYEFTSSDGKRFAYGPSAMKAPDGYRRADQPLGRVWPNPLRLAFPRR